MAINKTKVFIGIGLWIGMVAVILGVSSIPLTSHKVVFLPFESENEKAIVFFGFPTCHDICPTTLMTLNKLTIELAKHGTSPDVVFVNIDRDGSPEESDRYAKNFNEEFVGYFPTLEELSRMEQDFGLNFRQQGENISHMGRTYLVERSAGQWILVKTFNPSDYSLKQLTEEFNG